MTIAEAIRIILHQEGQAILRDATRFRALIRDYCFDAPKGELHITCVLLSENHVERLRVSPGSTTEQERIQRRLYDDFGFDKEIVSRAIAHWSCVLMPTAHPATSLGSADPEDVERLGISLSSQGKHDEAEGLLRRGLSLHSSNARLHAALAVIFRNQGRVRDALAEIKRARQLDPANVDYLVFEGELSLEQRTNRNIKMS